MRSRAVSEQAARVSRERAHSRRLVEHGAEQIWGWATPAGRRRALRRAGFFREVLHAGDVALELGCGTGLFTRWVAETGATIVAIDVSAEALGEARSATTALNVGYGLADAHQLPFHSNSFDVVYGSSVLHHLSLQACLAETKRVLRPGGQVLFAEPNLRNPQIWAERRVGPIRRLSGTSPDETAFVRERVAEELTTAGFVEVDVWPHEFLHPAVPEGLIPCVERLVPWLERVPGIREVGGSLLIRGRKRGMKTP